MSGNVMVTGANGFVGQALVQRLTRKAYTVRSAVRSDAAGDYIAIGDVGPATDWSAALSGIECVIHTVARVHVVTEKAKDPLSEFRRVNVEATLNLARQSLAAGVKRFIFLSSVKVNGEQTSPGKPFSEYDPADPQDAYALSKYEAEEELLNLAEESGMDVVIIRPPLVYGPNVKANFLSMMRWLRKGIPLPFGSIYNKRSLIGLGNLVDFIITCVSHPAASNQTFLVSDGEDLSTTELLQRTAIALGDSPRLLPVPQGVLEFGFRLMGKNELSRRLCGSLQVDISKTRRVLGWSPPVSVDEELRITAEAFLRTIHG